MSSLRSLSSLCSGSTAEMLRILAAMSESELACRILEAGRILCCTPGPITGLKEKHSPDPRQKETRMRRIDTSGDETTRDCVMSSLLPFPEADL